MKLLKNRHQKYTVSYRHKQEAVSVKTKLERNYKDHGVGEEATLNFRE